MATAPVAAHLADMVDRVVRPLHGVCGSHEACAPLSTFLAVLHAGSSLTLRCVVGGRQLASRLEARSEALFLAHVLMCGNVMEQTSGSDREACRIIQYALVATDDMGRECGTLSSYMLNDGPRISQYSYDVHHIDENLLESEGAPSQLDGMRSMLVFLEEQATHGAVVLVAHNGFSFDCKFLHHTLKRLRLSLPDKVAHFVDTLQLARDTDFTPPPPPNHKLGTLYRRATGMDITNAHDALADARAVATALFQLPELFRSRTATVHSWQKFQQLEEVRVQARAAARAVPVVDGMDASDVETMDDESTEGADREEGGAASRAGNVHDWRALREGEVFDKDTEQLFRASNERKGLRRRRHWHSSTSAWSVFLKLYAPLEDLIVDETNRYAVQKMAAKRIKHFLRWCTQQHQRTYAPRRPFPFLQLRRWKKLTARELRAFWYVLVRCAVRTTGRQFYSTSSAFMDVGRKALAGRLLGRHRFEQVMRFLHVSNSAEQPSRASPDHDAGYKVRKMLETAMHSWNKHFDPGAVISIDETLLPFKGRWEHNVTIRSKRHKRGIKLYVANGIQPNYVVAVDVKCSHHNREEEFEGTKVVRQLMESANLLDQHRTVVTDNYYTSEELLRDLKARKTYHLGVLRKTRAPAGARFSAADERQPRGFSKTMYSPSLDAIVVGWMDSKVIYCLSNASSSNSDHLARRRVRGVGATQVPQPDTLRVYNLGMGGVDWIDAAIGSLSFDQAAGRTRKWWKKVLWYVMDVMISNANAIYNQLHSRTTSRRGFVLELLEDLGDYLATPTPTTQAERVETVAHIPVLRTKRVRCVVCQRLTVYECSGSGCPPGTRLCHPQLNRGGRTCFVDYHRNPSQFRRAKRARDAMASPMTRRVRQRR